jgi:transcriptional regulator GlxA family with amidase domain
MVRHRDIARGVFGHFARKPYFYTMKHVSILIPAGKSNVSCIDGAYKLFARANEYLTELGKKELFTIQLVGHPGVVDLQSGIFSIRPNVNFKDVRKTDLIIIPAMDADIAASISLNKNFLPWIVRQYKQGAEVASFCIGAFLLASTGLLKGRNCSTHWKYADIFRKMFPDVNLVTDKTITDEYGIYTNGGAYSFLQLLLYLIEKYTDRETAIYCAKFFEIDIDRKHQSTFAIFSGLKDHQDEDIKKAQFFIEKNASKKISIEDLAKKCAIGRRNFDRRFIKATANTPVEYLQRVKMEIVKKDLETSRKTVNDVMYDVGYSDMKTFRELFKRITGLSPLEYRNKFNKEAVVL